MLAFRAPPPKASAAQQPDPQATCEAAITMQHPKGSPGSDAGADASQLSRRYNSDIGSYHSRGPDSQGPHPHGPNSYGLNSYGSNSNANGNHYHKTLGDYNSSQELPAWLQHDKGSFNEDWSNAPVRLALP